MNLGRARCRPGIHTVVQQIVSEVLDLPRERVRIQVADTDSSPYDSGTGGSKSTNSVGTAAYQAVNEVKENSLLWPPRGSAASRKKFRRRMDATALPAQSDAVQRPDRSRA